MYAVFARPGEAERHENYLTEWWVWIEQRREAALRWPAAFLQVVATITTTIFDRWFGPRLLSARAASMSATISLLAVNLVVSANVIRHVRIGWRPYWYIDIEPTRFSILAAFAFGALLLLLHLFVRRFHLIIVCAAIGLYYVPVLVETSVKAGYPPAFAEFLKANIKLHVSLVGAISLCLSLLCDVLFIALSRYLIRRALKSTSAFRISVLVFGTLVGGLALVSFPIVLFLAADPHMPSVLSMVLAPFGLTLAMMNLSDLLVALVFFIIALALVIHRLI
jgi:hypothetical protein